MSRDFFVYQGDFSQEYLRIPRKINAERRKKTRQAGELYLISGSLSLYDKLLKQGVLHCDPNNEGFWGLEFKEFRAAYDWLVEQMKSHVGLPPNGIQYPFWAWALIDGVSRLY